MLSIWESGSFHGRPHLAVVGGGIVGLFTALFYKRAHPGHRVMVLERGAWPSGASVKNAGFACFGSPSELLADIAKEGHEAALARVENRWRGLLELRAELGDATIGFEASGGHEIYRENDPLYTRVTEGFDALNDALLPLFGEAPFRWDDGIAERFGMKSIGHATRTDLEGPLDTGMLMSTLLSKVMAEGVFFRPMSVIRTIEEGNDGARLILEDGTRFHAGQVVVATNGYVRSLLPQLEVVPARGQVLLTSPIPGLRLRGTFHLDEGFYYFRDHQGSVLLGGGRNLDVSGETTTEEGTTPLVQDALERLLRQIILPDQPFSIVQRWSGIMGMGASKTPIIERMSERVTAAVRMGGMGVAIGIRVARRAAALAGDQPS